MSDKENDVVVHSEWVVDGPVRVNFDYIGEGTEGDFDPDDPRDRPLLRVDCNVRLGWKSGEPTDDPNWLYPQDGSICTAIDARTPIERQRVLLEMIAEHLHSVVDHGESVKGAMDAYSWMHANVNAVPDLSTKLRGPVTPKIMTTADKIEAIEKSGWPLAFDGCHKIYFLQDVGRQAQAESYGYDIHPSEKLRELISESCGLVFVTRWGYNNDDFDHPWNIEQGAEDIFEAAGTQQGE